MKVYRSLEEFKALPNAVVTQGTFDGVHKGHQKILSRLKDIAAGRKGETVLLSFFPHPRMVLQPENNKLKLLETVEEKTEHLAELGIDHLLMIPFTKEFSRLSAEEFVTQILLDTIGTKVLVVGYDHRFGKNREGSFGDLKELSRLYDFVVEEISEEDINEVAVSSTKIRNALMEGDLITANAFLGYNYKVSGEVVAGNKRGRDLGYPTANIRIPETYKLIPADGVYAVSVNFAGKTYGGMVNIGNRPTFGEQPHAFEVHLFNFNREIYGEQIRVEFIARLRNEIRFSSAEELIKQLEIDKFAAIKALEA